METIFTPQSLMGGRLYAAYAAVVELPVVMRLENHHTESLFHRQCLDCVTPYTPAKWYLFDLFAQNSLHTPIVV